MYNITYDIAVWGVRVSDNSNYVVLGTANGRIDIYARYCSRCQSGYYISNMTCRLCSLDMNGCATCRNSSYCLTCYLGYYLDQSSLPAQQCTQCDISLTGCMFCFNNTNCQKCASGYYLNGSTCGRCNVPMPNC
jgi:hypothetical protein